MRSLELKALEIFNLSLSTVGLSRDILFRLHYLSVDFWFILHVTSRLFSWLRHFCGSFRHFWCYFLESSDFGKLPESSKSDENLHHTVSHNKNLLSSLSGSVPAIIHWPFSSGEEPISARDSYATSFSKNKVENEGVTLDDSQISFSREKTNRNYNKVDNQEKGLKNMNTMRLLQRAGKCFNHNFNWN